MKVTITIAMITYILFIISFILGWIDKWKNRKVITNNNYIYEDESTV